MGGGAADHPDHECDRDDTTLLKVREPDPAAAGPAKLLATYRYKFPDPPPGCAGRNAEAMFLGADLIGRPPVWTVQLGGGKAGGGATNVEGVAFAWEGHDLNLLAENRDVYFVPASVYER